MMITLRVIHILTGVFWGGALFFTTLFLLPSMQASGPAAGPVMRQLVTVRRFPVFVSTAGTLTILSGLWMYWRNSSLSQGAWAGSRPGMVYGIGAAMALISFVVAMTFVAPTAKKLGQLGAAVAQSGAPPTPEQAGAVAALQHRMLIGSRVGAGLVAITIVAMAVARYV